MMKGLRGLVGRPAKHHLRRLPLVLPPARGLAMRTTTHAADPISKWLNTFGTALETGDTPKPNIDIQYYDI